MPSSRRHGALIVAAFILLTSLVPSALASAAATPLPSTFTPAVTQASNFGVSINSTDDVSRLSAMLHRPLSSVRVFLDNIAGAWSQSGLLASIPSNGTVALSFLSGSPAQVQAFLSGHPPTMTCYATYVHEPENNFTTAAQKAAYRTAWMSYGPAIRAAGCKPALILMKWSLSPKSGRNWHDWFPAGAVDVLGFDTYNTSAKRGAYDNRADYLAPIQAASRETGLPWAMPEVASDVPAGTTPADRAAWAHGVAAAAAADPSFLFGDWWDMVSKDGQRDYRLDSATAMVWHP